MTDRQLQLIEETWSYFLLNTEESGFIFYNRMFEIDPSLKNLFKGDIKSQSQKLVALVTFVVHKLNNFSEIVSDVEALGKRHRGYQVKPEHYSTLREALLWTLERVLGDRWTLETKQAWAELYNTLSTIMIKAAAR